MATRQRRWPGKPGFCCCGGMRPYNNRKKLPPSRQLDAEQRKITAHGDSGGSRGPGWQRTGLRMLPPLGFALSKNVSCFSGQ